MNETVLRGLWRSLTGGIGLLIMLTGLYVLLHATGLAPPLYIGQPGPGELTDATEPAVSSAAGSTSPLVFRLDLQEEPLRYGLLWMLGGVGAMLIGVVLTALALVRPEGVGKRVVLRGQGPPLYGGGRVTVSMRSMHALVAAVAERVPGVREAEPRLRLKQDGWHIDCQISLAPETSLPEVAGLLKQRLHEALEHHTGLPVTRIDVAGSLGLVDARRRVQ